MEEEERFRKRRKLTFGPDDLNVLRIGIAKTQDALPTSMPPETHPKVADSGTIVVDELNQSATDLNVQHDDDQSHTNPITKTASSDRPVSKNQLKKILRDQAWEAGRDYRKARRREKVRAKKERKRAAKAAEVQSNARNPVTLTKSALSPQDSPQRTDRKRAVQLPVTFIIDCSFNDLMKPKEIISLGSQLTRAYSDNLKAPFRAHIVVSSFGGILKERFDTVLSAHHQNWKYMSFTGENCVTAANEASEAMKSDKGELAGTFRSLELGDHHQGELIYLTSDSSDTLSMLKPHSTYIVGGLVDKNRHKGICYKTAMDLGVKTARLPIGDYMQMSSRFVLTTNHVVEIMLKWLECGDWAEAFEKVIPKRKGGIVKGKDGVLQRAEETNGCITRQ